MNLKKMIWEDVVWIYMVHARDMGWALVKGALNLQVV